jgi:hypothetical protein
MSIVTEGVWLVDVTLSHIKVILLGCDGQVMSHEGIRSVVKEIFHIFSHQE